MVEDPPVILQGQEVGQGVLEGGQEAMEEGQEAMEEDQEAMEEDQEQVSLDGLGAQVGGLGARYGDQGVRHGDQGAPDQGAGLALLKGGHGGKALVEEGHPPTLLTGDQVHHPHQGHVAPPLRSWVMVGGADGRGHPAMEEEVQGGGGRPLLHLGLNLCCPLKKGRRGRRRKANYWRGYAMTRARSCLPTI